MKNLKYIILLMLAFGFIACENEELDELRDHNGEDEAIILPELTSGSADFSKFVTLGNSLTAGFTDNALFIASQNNSLPNILSQKFALVGGGSFNQPLMNDNFGGIAIGGQRILQPRLVFGGAGPVPLESLIGPVTVSTDLAINNPTGPFNNMGVPGAKSFHLAAPGYGNIAGVAIGAANPYFVRMASNPNTTVIADAVSQNPSFFSLWIGNNDVLGFATSGGSGVSQEGNLDPSTYSGNDITDSNVFANVYSQLVAGLTANGAKGIVANIPDVTTIPFFTTVPHNPVPLDANTAGAVNQAYAPYNGGLLQAEQAGFIDADERAARTINFTASSSNAVVIVDEDLTNLGGLGLPNFRQATANDLLVLPAISFIGTLADPNNPLSVNGVAVPLADRWVLTPNEQQMVATATQSYNATIASVAAANGLAFVDANALLTQLFNGGIPSGNFILTSNLVTGGAFSLDGVHPNARGYALIANEFMKAIDAAYGSNFEDSGNFVDVGNFPTNYSPTLQ